MSDLKRQEKLQVNGQKPSFEGLFGFPVRAGLYNEQSGG